MRRQRIAALLACGVATAGMTGVARASVTKVQAGTHELLLDQQPWTPVGYSYNPVAIGEPYAPPAIDSQTCKVDAPMMAAAGVNTVRMPVGSPPWDPTRPGLNDCLTALAAHGIGVIWTLGRPPGSVVNAAWLEAYRATIEATVLLLKDNPATRVWLINNEQELQCGHAPPAVQTPAQCDAAWFGTSGAPGMLNDLADTVKSLDPNHLVGTSVSALECLSPIASANAPDLDLWAINAYPNVPAGGFNAQCSGGLFATASRVDARPKLISEFGTDRWECGDLTVDNGVVTCGRTTSGARQDIQAQWLVSDWSQIKANLASSSNPQGAVSGANVFMYADNWDWCNAFCGVGSAATHDLGGDTSPGAADGFMQLEWMGVAHALPPKAPYPRLTTQAFHDLAAQWGHGGPDIVAGSLVVRPGDNCVGNTISWQTTEAATSEVYLGEQAITANSGQESTDDTVFARIVPTPAGSSTSTTVHSVTFDAAPTALVAVRSQTPDGRVVTSVPQPVGC